MSSSGSFALICAGAVLSLGGAAAHAQAPSRWQIGLAATALQSQWDERDTHGQTLLREQGLLQGIGAVGRYDVRDWSLGWSGQLLDGRRHYDGRTQAGVPVQTHVNAWVWRSAWHVDYLWSGGLMTGLGWGQRAQRRELLSVPGVATGYTERWRSDELSVRLGLRWQAQGQWEASLAWAPWARTHLRLQAPNIDDAVLSPQRQQVAQLALQWRRPINDSWFWSLGGQAEWRRTHRSDPVPLMRNGVWLRSSVLQPDTREVLYGVGLQLSYLW